MDAFHHARQPWKGAVRQPSTARTCRPRVSSAYVSLVDVVPAGRSSRLSWPCAAHRSSRNGLLPLSPPIDCGRARSRVDQSYNRPHGAPTAHRGSLAHAAIDVQIDDRARALPDRDAAFSRRAHCPRTDRVHRAPRLAGQPSPMRAWPSGTAVGCAEPAAAPLRSQQVDREFVPFVSVVQVGTVVSFPNRDPILHHVVFVLARQEPSRSSSTAASRRTRSPSTSPASWCSAATSTTGWWPTSWWCPRLISRRSEAGAPCACTTCPPGTYELHAWHPLQRAAWPSQTVTVPRHVRRAGRVQLDLQSRKAKFKPPLDRLKY